MFWTKRKYILLGGGSVVLIAALAVAAATTRRNRVIPATLPEQTTIHVRLDQAVASDQNRPGDHFTATVSEPIVLDNKTIVPQGAEVEGVVVDAERSGRLKGRARLNLALDAVNINGTEYPLRTTSAVRVGGKHKNRNIALIGGAAGGGALIGAIAGGGKGALIGGPIGAGAGTAVALFTGRKNIHLRPETPLTFRLAEPVTINTKT
jgi:hypothetical protein